jgi:hypothetical protein
MPDEPSSAPRRELLPAPTPAEPDDAATAAAPARKRRRGSTVSPGTAAYLTELEIIRELQLPDKVGRAKMAMWKLDPTFPKPEPGTGGRRFWPSIEKWMGQHHGLDTTAIIPVADGRENFDAWRQQRKTRKAGKAKEPGDAGSCLSPAEGRMDSAVVTPFRPGAARLSKDGAPGMAAVGTDPTAA